MTLTKPQKVKRGALLVMSCVLLAACQSSTSSGQGNATIARNLIGTSLPGAQGATLQDQDKIDSTVARACGVGIYSEQACDLHSAASAARRSR